MTPNLLETAKLRRRLLIEKKQLKEDIRQMRHRRMSKRPEPVREVTQTKSPAA